MPTLQSGDTLSLAGIGVATGNAGSPNYSLGTIVGSTTNPIPISSFGINAVQSLSGYTYIAEDTTEDYTLNFSGSGDNFGLISSYWDNYGWTISGGNIITLPNTNERNSSVTLTVGSMGSSTALAPIISHSLSVVFGDGVNQHAIGYGVARSKTIYSVDSYDGNTTALCLTLDTPITLENGETIPAGDLEEGMKLKSVHLDGMNEETPDSYLEWSDESPIVVENVVKVKDTIFSFTDKIYNFNDGLIKCTSEHPFMVLGTDGVYRFKRAHLIQEGESFTQLIDGEYVTTPIESIEIIQEDTEIVSIDVDGSNLYIANNIVTHNKEGDTHTDFVGPDKVSTPTYSAPDISWTEPSTDADSTEGVTGYDIQILLASNDSYVDQYNNWGTTSVQWLSGFGGSNLTPGTNYKIKVRAISSGLRGDWSDTLTITYGI
jgi:hypothetical protein